MENIIAYQNGKPLRELENQEYFLAKRDIAGFYEEQSNWSTLYGDSDFGTALKLPYWDYLELRNLNDFDTNFLRTGSLLILASMALEPYEELGRYYLLDKEKNKLFSNAITSFIPKNQNEVKLKNIILDLRSSLEIESTETTLKRLENELRWIHLNYIYGYFRNKSKSFGEHIEVLYLKENGN